MKISTKFGYALFNDFAYFMCFEMPFLGKTENKKYKIVGKVKLLPTLVQVYRIS